MIQPHELQRFYLYDYCNNVVEVIELFRDGLCTIKNFKTGVGYTNVNQSDLDAIPLTEKILTEWCPEVVSNPYQDRYEIGNIHIQYNGFTDTLWIDGMPHITYLHQLQMLILALTNQPLKIELK